MFEEQTYEALMERMIDRLPDDIDKRENSVIWNALAPAAAELAQSYIWLDQVFELVFADTAQGEFLDRRAAEVGIEENQRLKRFGPRLLSRRISTSQLAHGFY